MRLNNIFKVTMTAGILAINSNLFASITTFTTSGSIAKDGSSGSQDVAGIATFDDNGSGLLTVYLQNISSASTYGNAQTLFGLFFDTGDSSLVLQSVTEPIGDVEWTVTTHNPGQVTTSTTNYISSPTANTQWKTDTLGGQYGVDGTQGGPAYGLVSTNFGAPFYDGIKSGSHNPYLESALTFTFSYTGDLDVSNVNFLWGTTVDTCYTTPGTPTTTSVPEASTVIAASFMLLPLGIGAVRSLRKERTPKNLGS